jgi:hypothetical protein
MVAAHHKEKHDQLTSKGDRVGALELTEERRRHLWRRQTLIWGKMEESGKEEGKGK